MLQYAAASVYLLLQKALPDERRQIEAEGIGRAHAGALVEFLTSQLWPLSNQK